MKLLTALAFAVLLAGCAQNSDDSTSANSNGTTSTGGGAAAPPERASGEDVASRQPKDGDEVGVIETNLGKIVVMFFPDVAPKHVENFKFLATSSFYDDTKFHRCIKDFMIQGGDPNSKDNDRANDGQGDSPQNVEAEFSMIEHKRGILSMARKGDPNEQTGAMPAAEFANSGSCQFFIVLKDSPFLDKRYTAFGKVLSGMDVADKIVNLPQDGNNNPMPANPAIIKSVKIVKWPVK